MGPHILASISSTSMIDSTFRSSYLMIDSNNNGSDPNSPGEGTIPPLSPLANFLVERASNSISVANFLFWYLKVETEDETHGEMYQYILDAFLSTLHSNPDTKLITTQLLAMATYVNDIVNVQWQARDEPGKQDEKARAMKKFLVVSFFYSSLFLSY